MYSMVELFPILTPKCCYTSHTHTYSRVEFIWWHKGKHEQKDLPTGAINWLPGGNSGSGFSGSRYKSQ